MAKWRTLREFRVFFSCNKLDGKLTAKVYMAELLVAKLLENNVRIDDA